MPTARGAILAATAVILFVVGAALGVEEFELVTACIAVLLVVGWASVWWRTQIARSSLEITAHIPVAEVSIGRPVVAELEITNTGDVRMPSLRLEDPARRWLLSHPGLGARARARDVPGRSLAPSTPGHASGNGVVVGSGDASRSPGSSRTLDVALDGSTAQDSPNARWAGGAALAGALTLPSLRSKTTLTLPVHVPTSERGLVTLHGVGAWCEDPFRVFARRVAVGVDAQVLVCPVPDAALAPDLPSHAFANGGPADTVAAVTATRRQAGDELSSLRPYVPGDRLNRLHWPVMARSGDLVVRDFTASESGRLALLLDVRPSAHGPKTFEAVIDKAAALGERALDGGATVELYTSAGERLEIPPTAAGHQILRRAFAMLAPAAPPSSSALRWSGSTAGTALWAMPGHREGGVVLVSTAAGAPSALPVPLQRRATVVTAP